MALGRTEAVAAFLQAWIYMNRRQVVSSLALMAVLFLSFSATVLADKAGFVPVSANSKILNLEQYSGKVVLLDFWASWCPSCRTSLPWLQSLKDRYKDRGFEVLAVNLDSDCGAGKKAASDLGLQIPVVYDPEGTTAESFQVKSMPSSFLIGPDGQIKAAFEGFRESKKGEIEQQIVELLPR